jgi:hypothetical protein
MSGWDDLPDGPDASLSDDPWSDFFSDEDTDYEGTEDEDFQAEALSVLKRKRGRPASKLSKPKPLASKKTAGSHSRKSASIEKKAKTIAYYDSLPVALPGNGVFKRRCNRVAKKMHVHSGHTVAKWISAQSRANVRAVIGRPISDYAPGRQIRNKGGRGKRAAGRWSFHISLNGRRGAKYPLAEEQLITWCRDQRKKGHKLTTRIIRVKMVQFVVNHYGDSTGFKASTGWTKRFMARYKLTWRRRNDNAKASIESLVGPCANFITSLRKFRMQHPAADSESETAKYGAFGLHNSFNVDQVPLPFASADPRTIEFMGTERVWIKQPGSGLDKRQATLQLLIRPLGTQPRPCLLFRGHAKPKRACDRRKREEEEKGYDQDVQVLWQAKAWADTATCIEWSRVCFKEFVDADAHIKEGEETLLLADSLRSQVKATFRDAAKTNARAHTIFGVKNGSHVWQPVDHHVGAAYHRKMDAYYVEWMASADGELYAQSVPVGKRRQLMTQWAGRAYRELEAARELAEEKQAADASSPPSMFYAAFLRTGCLVTADGSDDNEIRPHRSIAGELEEQFKSAILKPSAIDISEHVPEEPFIVMLDNESSSEGEDSEDKDDEPPEGDDEDDGEREPIDNDIELEVEDEEGLMHAAAQAARDNGQAELRDFNLARRVARQDGFAVQPRFAGARAAGNSRRQEIYDADVAAWEQEMNKKANARVLDILWNTAQAKALEEEAQARPSGVDVGDDDSAPRRVGRRVRRNRV